MPRGRGRHGRRGHRHHHHHHHGYSSSPASIRLPIEAIPTSSPGCLVFPYDHANKRFKITDYNPIQTQDRVSAYEIETFFQELNAPFLEWYGQYEEVSEGKGKYAWLCLLSLLLLPLFFFYICWLSTKQQDASDKWGEAAEKAKRIIQEKSQSFADRGLTWNVPQFFPSWLELWTGVGGSNLPNFGGMQMPGQFQGGIQMIAMQQQSYPGAGGNNMMMMQNQPQGNQVMPMPQYNANTYQNT